MSDDPQPKLRLHATPGRRLVLIAFTAVGVGVLVVTVFAIAQTQALGTRAGTIVGSMMTSVRLLNQLQSEMEERQILLNEHILASQPRERSSLEIEIARIDARIAVTMSAHDPWVTLPGERSTWDQTRRDLRALAEPMARVLVLSRENRDTEARAVMETVAVQFASVIRDLDRLISINDRGATESLSRVSGIRLRLVLTLVGIGLVGLAGTVLLGRWAARRVARREDEMSINARMLEERNRDLDAFAGRVAHDLRGPLATIKLATAQITATLPQQHRATDILRRGAKRMEALVDDLLALAQVEARGGGRCDPATVAAQIREDFSTRIEDEKGALRVAVDHAEVPCSEGLLRQALANLTENAVKYQRVNVAPQVEISGATTDGGYDLRVSDNGWGMPAEEAGRVFEPFYRSPRTQNLPEPRLLLNEHPRSRRRAQQFHARGSVTVTIVRSLCESTAMVPPWPSTICLTM